MADTFGDLDWRDSPKASPACGSILHSRQGKNGDFHVVLPFPGGGLVHWWRDNFRPELPWNGGDMFGSGEYLGAAICETDYASHAPTTIKNLDVVAVTKEGRVEVWTRECGGAYRWSLLILLNGRFGAKDLDGTGAPSLAYSGACFKKGLLDFELKSHGIGTNLIAYPSRSAGIQFWWCANLDTDRQWYEIYILNTLNTVNETTFSALDPRRVVGVSATMFCDREQAVWSQSWKAMNSEKSSVVADGLVFAIVFEDGGLTVRNAGLGHRSITVGNDYRNHITLYSAVDLSVPLPGGGADTTPARGRPAVLQSDYLLQERVAEAIPVVFTPSPQVGDLVVMAPGKNGGILFWLKNFGDYNDPLPFGEGWNFQYQIGTEPYDDVSVIQANFLKEGNKNHNLEITARRADLPGFHQYWCDWKGNWGGPIHVLGEVTKTIQQPLQPQTTLPPLPAPAPAPTNDPLVHLAAIGIDYSVTETDLRAWLADPVYTPYPALAQALSVLILPRRLARPVQIDVVRGFYEADGVASPRSASDVDLYRLRWAIVQASNERYGESATDFAALVTA